MVGKVFNWGGIFSKHLKNIHPCNERGKKVDISERAMRKVKRKSEKGGKWKVKRNIAKRWGRFSRGRGGISKT